MKFAATSSCLRLRLNLITFMSKKHRKRETFRGCQFSAKYAPVERRYPTNGCSSNRPTNRFALSFVASGRKCEKIAVLMPSLRENPL